MDVVLLVFAEHLKDVGVRQQIVRDLDGERFGVHFWIIKGHLVVQVTEIAAAEAWAACWQTLDCSCPLPLPYGRRTPADAILESRSFSTRL